MRSRANLERGALPRRGVHDVSAEAVVGELPAAVVTAKDATIVLERGWFDYENSLNFLLVKYHFVSFLKS